VSKFSRPPLDISKILGNTQAQHLLKSTLNPCGNDRC
jgi:hypothetical protein